MSIKIIIYEIFESKEMADCLVKNVNKLSEQDILNMICSAPIDIRRKAEILKELAETENVDSIIILLDVVFASIVFGYPRHIAWCFRSKHRLCVHTTLHLQATHLDIQILPLARHLLGQIPKTL